MSNESLKKRLEGISKCSINGERAKNLYQLLVNKLEIWELAYANICANDGIANEDPNELLIEKKSINFDLNAIFGSNEE